MSRQRRGALPRPVAALSLPMTDGKADAVDRAFDAIQEALNRTAAELGVRVRVDGGADAGPARRRLNLVPGSSYVEIAAVDDPADQEIDVTITLAGGVPLADGDKGDITVSGGGAAWAIDPGVVSDAKLRASAGVSVIGRAVAAAGTPADIVAGADGAVLRRAAGVLGFGTIPESSVAGLAADLAALELAISSATDEAFAVSTAHSFLLMGA